MSNIPSEADSLAGPHFPSFPEATETDFEQWLTELLPGVRAAIAQHGFAKAQGLAAFQLYMQERKQLAQ